MGQKKKIGYLIRGSIKNNRGNFTGYIDTKEEAVKRLKEFKSKKPKGIIWTEDWSEKKTPKKVEGPIKNIRLKKVYYKSSW